MTDDTRTKKMSWTDGKRGDDVRAMEDAAGFVKQCLVGFILIDLLKSWPQLDC